MKQGFMSVISMLMAGERCQAKRSGKRGQRLSLISAVLGSQPQQLIEPDVFSGHCERTWVEQWLEHLCQGLPQGEKHYLILDNASFHKGGRIAEIAKRYGHVLMYLPLRSSATHHRSSIQLKNVGAC